MAQLCHRGQSCSTLSPGSAYGTMVHDLPSIAKYITEKPSRPGSFVGIRCAKCLKNSGANDVVMLG